MLEPVLGSGIYFNSGFAVGANARVGIIAPGKTHCEVVAQPLKLYCSLLVTAYPRRLDNTGAQ
jgi:hypothetical protein